MSTEESRILTAEHARESGVDRSWEDSNGAWWDWYLSLAADDEGAPAELVQVDPPQVAPSQTASSQFGTGRGVA